MSPLNTFLFPLLRFYSSPYSISTNQMIVQTSITPCIAASPVSTYQVGGSRLWSPGLGPDFFWAFLLHRRMTRATSNRHLLSSKGYKLRVWINNFYSYNSNDLTLVQANVAKHPTQVPSDVSWLPAQMSDLAKGNYCCQSDNDGSTTATCHHSVCIFNICYSDICSNLHLLWKIWNCIF